MHLLVSSIEKETPTLHKNNIRLQTIGDTSRMPKEVKQRLDNCIDYTSKNTGLTLILALSYSSQWEITEMVKSIAEQVKNNTLNIEDITKETISKNLTTKNLPDPDLLIRTSGEVRISNFLLWQLAYTELYFTEIRWPDFHEEEFYKAIYDFQQRERRFGEVK
jgi:undecaprenyl diphosphate synthase